MVFLPPPSPRTILEQLHKLRFRLFKMFVFLKLNMLDSAFCNVVVPAI